MRYTYVFFSEFYRFALKKSLIHFEFFFFFNILWAEGPTSFFYMWLSSCCCTICWRDSSFLLNDLGTLVENQFTIVIWVYFWTLNSIPLIYMSLLMLYCFHYYSFVVGFEIRNLSPPTFTFSRLFWLFGSPLQFYVNFSISLPISVIKAVGVLIKIVLNL